MIPGDHLVSPRTGYRHHGIYIGKDEVIHYSGLSDGLTAGPIEICTLSDFRGSSYIRIKPWKSRGYSHRRTVKRAYERVGESEYNLLTNNCEHFATWCVFGEARSVQVERSFEMLAVSHAASLAATHGPAAAASILLKTTAGRAVLTALSGVIGSSKVALVAPLLAAAAPTITTAATAASVAAAVYYAATSLYDRFRG